MTKPKPKWINLPKDDSSGSLREWYILGTVLAGAQSVGEIMAVTYLSQFRDLNGEFATSPVFRPDFRVGSIPYSSDLLKVYNRVASSIDAIGEGRDLSFSPKDNTKAEIDLFVCNGAQLGRLYESNVKLLEKCKDDKRDLFHLVRECIGRDRAVIKNLAYAKDF